MAAPALPVKWDWLLETPRQGGTNQEGEEEEKNNTHIAEPALLNKGTKSKSQYCILLILE